MGGCSTVEGREGRSSTVAVRMARWRGNAGGRRGEHGVFIAAARLRGDGSGRRRCRRGTRPRPTRVRRGAAVKPAVYGARPAGTARTNGGVRPGRTPRSLGAWARGEGATWDGGRPWATRGLDAEVIRRAGARDVAARWRPGPNCFAGHQFEINFLQNLVYKCTKR
jgi:hypothetical protein